MLYWHIRNAQSRLFTLGVSNGGRISELLSLTIGDVWQNGKAVTDLLYDKNIVKGGEVSRAVPVNVDGMRSCGKRCRRCRLTANFSKGSFVRFGYALQSPIFLSQLFPNDRFLSLWHIHHLLEDAGECHKLRTYVLNYLV